MLKQMFSLGAAILLIDVSSSVVAADIVPACPLGVFLDGEELSFACGGVGGRPYRVKDWRQQDVVGGTVSANGEVTFGRLGPGYFTLEIAEDARTNAVSFVVVRPPRQDRGAALFGVDSAQSWTDRKRLRCPWYGGDLHRALSETAGRLGLSHVRDRLAPSGADETLRNARLLAAAGVATCTDIDGVLKAADPIAKLPRDLAAYYGYCRSVAAKFGDVTRAWEVFNEQDACGASEPVWDYAAAQKAAYLGLKAGNPNCTVLPGAVCLNVRGVYDEGMYANDLKYYGDVFNLHLYRAPAQFTESFGDLHRFMARAGIGGRAVWITENGMDLEGAARDASCVKGVWQHSAAQELLQAEYYPKAQVAMLMGGISRGYFFFFGSYHERGGAKDWGTFRRDGTVKPVCAAMATVTRELGDAELLGEVDLGVDLRGYLFSHPNGTRTLAFWSASPVDTGKGWPLDANECAKTLELRVTDGAYRLSDLCGGAKRMTVVDGQTLSLTATRYPSYLHGRFDLSVVREPCAKGTAGATVPPVGTDLSVVFRVDLDRVDFGITRGKTVAELKRSSGHLTVQAWNLSDTVKTGIVAVAGCLLRGVPEAVVLPAFGKAEFAAELTVPAGRGETELRLSGHFNGRTTTALVMPVVHLDEAFLAKCRIVDLVGSRKPSQWRRNDSAARQSCTWDESEQAIRFHYEWDDPKADKWFYPSCRLSLPDESLDDALMLEFEVKSAQDKVENDYHVSNLLLGTFIAYPPPMKDWESRRIPLSGVKPDAVEFSLGANPRGMKVDYWVRNMRLVKKDGKDR